MDVILDTNVYEQDFKMQGNQFQELFVYLRRSGSRLVVPSVVSIELPQRYRLRLTEEVNRARGAWRGLQRKALTHLGDFPGFDIEGEVDLLKARLYKPASGVTAVDYSDVTAVDVKEVIRRGAMRVRPANADGEELRDVILWLVVLQYAKQASKEVALVSGDNTFKAADATSLHEDLASDLLRCNLPVKFYPDVSGFIIGNSMQTEDVDENWVYALVERRAIEEEAKRGLSSFTVWGSIVQGVELDVLRLRQARKYRVGADAFYAELHFYGTARLAVLGSQWVTLNSAEPTQTQVHDFNYVYQKPDQAFLEAYNPTLSHANYVSVLPQFFDNGVVHQTGFGLNSANFRVEPVERTYRCDFEIQLSARIVADKLVSLQTEKFDTKRVTDVPNLAPQR